MENVLEIKITKINNDWSVWEITHQDEEVFERGKFEDEELGVYSIGNPALYNNGRLGIRGKIESVDLRPISIANKDIPLLEEKVKAINKKYGKRWRARKGELFYFILENGEIDGRCNNDIYIDKELYNLGNYFKTKEEAEKYRDKIKEILTKRKL